MFLRHLPLLALCAPAGETPEATTAGSTPAPAPEPAPVVENTTTPEPPKPGVIAQAVSLLRGANSSAATIAALRADLTARDATIADYTAQITARDQTIQGLNEQLTTFRAQEAQLQSTITALETQRTDVQTEVIHQLAASGLPEPALPKASTTALAATAEELWAQAEAEPDAVKKGKLAAQAMKITAGKIHGSN